MMNDVCLFWIKKADTTMVWLNFYLKKADATMFWGLFGLRKSDTAMLFVFGIKKLALQCVGSFLHVKNWHYNVLDFWDWKSWRCKYFYLFSIKKADTTMFENVFGLKSWHYNAFVFTKKKQDSRYNVLGRFKFKTDTTMKNWCFYWTPKKLMKNTYV